MITSSIRLPQDLCILFFRIKEFLFTSKRKKDHLWRLYWVETMWTDTHHSLKPFWSAFFCATEASKVKSIFYFQDSLASVVVDAKYISLIKCPWAEFGRWKWDGCHLLPWLLVLACMVLEILHLSSAVFQCCVPHFLFAERTLWQQQLLVTILQPVCFEVYSFSCSLLITKVEHMLDCKESLKITEDCNHSVCSQSKAELSYKSVSKRQHEIFNCISTKQHTSTYSMAQEVIMNVSYFIS